MIVAEAAGWLTATPCHIQGMKGQESPASGIVVVRVHMADNPIGGKPAVRLYAVALPRDQALEAVQHVIPSHYTAELTDQRPSIGHVTKLALKPGVVRELTDIDANARD